MADDVLQHARKIAVPSENEALRLRKVLGELESKANAQLKKEKINARVFAGGSVGKGTWLPGISDIDIFILFKYELYKDKSAQLSDFAARALKKAFKNIERLHGSRDYFSANYSGFYVEFVPVLEIKKPNEAKNLTDFSPLHVGWMRRKISRNKVGLMAEIRLAKQFFKAAGVYGAESYISGFSGHAIEILVVYYGSFIGLLRSAAKWQEAAIIDVEKKFKSKKDVFETMNKSKLQSPLILIDPVEPGRNALAALRYDKFQKLKETAGRFLRSPRPEFFTEKRFSTESLLKKRNNSKLVILNSKAGKGKPDVVGCALLAKFKKIKYGLELEDFKIRDSGWSWDSKTHAHYWFYFQKKKLPAMKQHLGPPAKLKEFANAFRKKWRTAKVVNGRLVAEIKRNYVAPEQLIKALIKKDKSTKIEMIK